MDGPQASCQPSASKAELTPGQPGVYRGAAHLDGVYRHLAGQLRLSPTALERRRGTLNQYRKKKRRPDEVSTMCISDLPAALTLRSSNDPRSAEDSALESMTDEDVSTALAALREDTRTTVYYADVLQFSYKEIAVISDCPTARSCHGCIEDVNGCVRA
jgi:hypothetical protein